MRQTAFALTMLLASAASGCAKKSEGSGTAAAARPTVLRPGGGKFLGIETVEKGSLEAVKAALIAKVAPHDVGGMAASESKSYVACGELTTVAETHVCVFNAQNFMNYAINRATTYIEVGGSVMDHETHVKHDLVRLVAGHDLRGADLRDYAAAYAEARPSMAAPNKQNDFLGDIARRIGIEDEFWSIYLNQRLEAQPDLVLLAVSIDNDMDDKLDHEILHARYFKTPAMQTAVATFFKETVPAAQQQEIREILAANYDVALDGREGKAALQKKNDLLYNEFQAYVLMNGAENSKLADYVADLQPRLKAALKAAGVSL